MMKLFNSTRKRELAAKEKELQLEAERLELERDKLRQSEKVMQMIQMDQQAVQVEQRQFGPPEIMKGVVPAGKTAPIAMDSCSSIYNYASQGDPSFYPAFIGYPALATMSQSSDYRSVPETTSTEMTREWGRFKIVDQDVADETLTGVERARQAEQNLIDRKIRQDKITKLTDAFKAHDIRSLIQKTFEVEMTMGRAQIYIDLKHKAVDVPFVRNSRGVSVGDLVGFSLIEPMWTTPSAYNATDPTKRDFYVPQSWFVLGREIHADRLITVITRPVPDMLKPAYNFGGISMLQLMRPYVERYQRNVDSVSELINSYSLTILATDMSSILAGNQDPNILMRLMLFNQFKSNRGIMALDKESEEISQINTPLSGLDGLVLQSKEDLSGPSKTPLVKLWGISPSGLNASGEAEIDVYYDYIAAQQEAHARPVIETIHEVMQLSMFGEIDPAIQWEFNSLKQMDAAEQATIQKTKAESDQIRIDSGVISQGEARSALVADPEGEYGSLIASEVPELPDFDYDSENYQQ